MDLPKNSKTPKNFLLSSLLHSRSVQHCLEVNGWIFAAGGDTITYEDFSEISKSASEIPRQNQRSFTHIKTLDSAILNICFLLPQAGNNNDPIWELPVLLALTEKRRLEAFSFNPLEITLKSISSISLNLHISRRLIDGPNSLIGDSKSMSIACQLFEASVFLIYLDWDARLRKWYFNPDLKEFRLPSTNMLSATFVYTPAMHDPQQMDSENKLDSQSEEPILPSKKRKTNGLGESLPLTLVALREEHFLPITDEQKGPTSDPEVSSMSTKLVTLFETITGKAIASQDLPANAHAIIKFPECFELLGFIVACSRSFLCYSVSGGISSGEGKLTICHEKLISVPECHIVGYSLIDNGNYPLRYMLADAYGTIRLLTVLYLPGTEPLSLQLETICNFHCPSSIACFNRGILLDKKAPLYVFVGSQVGDSALIRISVPEHVVSSSHESKKIASFSNPGPILDIHVRESLSREAQPQEIIVASGYGESGSIRIIQRLVDVKVEASFTHPGIINIFVVKIEDEVKGFIFTTLRNSWLVLSPGPSQKIYSRYNEFVHQDQTLAAGSFTLEGEMMTQDVIVQVLSTEVNCYDSSFCVVTCWKSSSFLELASICENWILLLDSNKNLILLCLRLKTNPEIFVAKEILTDGYSICNFLFLPNFIFLTQWGANEIFVFSSFSNDFSALEFQRKIILPLTTDPHEFVSQIAHAKMGGDHALFVGLTTGDLLLLHPADPMKSKLDFRRVSMGVEPITFGTLRRPDSESIVCLNDAASLIFSTENSAVIDVPGLHTAKLKFFKMRCVCQVQTAAAEGQIQITWANNSSFFSGTIDTTSRVQEKIIPVGMTPDRILLLKEDEDLLAVACTNDSRTQESMSRPENGSCLRVYELRQEGKSSVIFTDDYAEYETASSLCQFTIKGNSFLAVGCFTSEITKSLSPKSLGTIRIYRINNSTLKEEPVLIPLEKKDMEMPASFMTFFKGHLIVGGRNILSVISINPSVYYDCLLPDDMSGLTEVSKAKTHTIITDLDASSEFLLVADFQKSVSLVRLEDNNTLCEFGKGHRGIDFCPVKLVRDNSSESLFVAYNETGLIQFLSPPCDSPTSGFPEGRVREIAAISWPTQINCFAVSNSFKEQKGHEDLQVFFGTSVGSIGILQNVQEDDHFRRFIKIQNKYKELSGDSCSETTLLFSEPVLECTILSRNFLERILKFTKEEIAVLLEPLKPISEASEENLDHEIDLLKGSIKEYLLLNSR
eukprot:GHVP01003769.1.p1 GENE.GHVP01003769.1~~GHVP01003769.1.p1  ORF type:complete len:1241 (-),score=208.18 GHVP01003769.1:380-4102(-)